MKTCWPARTLCPQPNRKFDAWKSCTKLSVGLNQLKDEPGRTQGKRRAQTGRGLRPRPALAAYPGSHYLGRGQPAAAFAPQPATVEGKTSTSTSSVAGLRKRSGC